MIDDSAAGKLRSIMSPRIHDRRSEDRTQSSLIKSGRDRLGRFAGR